MTITEYFTDGGLLQILNRNHNGTFTRLLWVIQVADDRFQESFTASQGAVGGKPVPSNVLLDQKIFRPSVPDVLVYLQTFGLSQEEASRVVEKIGTEPQLKPA